jgi:hypothetical protein
MFVYQRMQYKHNIPGVRASLSRNVSAGNPPSKHPYTLAACCVHRGQRRAEGYNARTYARTDRGTALHRAPGRRAKNRRTHRVITSFVFPWRAHAPKPERPESRWRRRDRGQEGWLSQAFNVRANRGTGRAADPSHHGRPRGGGSLRSVGAPGARALLGESSGASSPGPREMSACTRPERLAPGRGAGRNG